MIGLNKFCHMSKILLALKIHNFEQLYIKSKLSFLNSIKNNNISLYIFKKLNINKSITKKSKSFKNDIKFIVSYFKTDIETIFADPTFYKNKLKKNTFNDENGIVDSITTCFNHFKSPKYRKILNP